MPRLQRILPVIAIALGLFLAGVRAAAAQNPTPSDNDVNRVAKQLYCPVCENIPLDVCPTTACAEWRELIRQKLAAGWSDQQIKDYFVLQYGDRVLGEPPQRGLNWSVYFLPPLFIIIGVGIIYMVLRGARAAPAKAGVGETPKPVEPLPSDDPYLKKVEEELKKQN
jgi:cytochrome c-type biogenesis protein CcmH